MQSPLGIFGLDADLLEKYDRPGPRYTSYPTAPHFSPSSTRPPTVERLGLAAQRADEPLSMYVHLPFCQARCTFCGCNVVISPRRGPEEAYLDALEAGARSLPQALGPRKTLNQLHWGGGTPTYLSPAQCEGLFDAITSQVPAHARRRGRPRDRSLRHHHGTPRDPAAARLQPPLDGAPGPQPGGPGRGQTDSTAGTHREHVDEARRLGFTSVNIDLIYGLPLQTEEGFRATVSAPSSSELEPDRVACFSYAHVPWIKPHQKQLERQRRCPADGRSFNSFSGAAEEFSHAGYRFVGFDHFARPDDELARALDEDRVHRNFMGYTVMPASDQVGDRRHLHRRRRRRLRGQRQESSAVYKRSVEVRLTAGGTRTRPATVRKTSSAGGHPPDHLHPQTRLRLGGDRLRDRSPRALRRRLEELEPMAEDGLVEIDDNGLVVTPTGRFFLRNLCMPFDAYLGEKRPDGPKYSRTV